ncbi:MAG: HPr family phosphocarrier protein [Clostridia bacterium]|nr:HPr family phosphocarrier protein [Clostridia bacterium]
MKTVVVKLSKINDVKDLVNAAHLCDYDIDIISGKYIADAKSIMGIFGLDLNSELTLQIYSDTCDDFLDQIKNIIVR